MRQIAYLVRCNENVMAVILNKRQLAVDEKDSLQWREYTKVKTKFNNDFEAYLEKNHWRISEHIVIERATPRHGPHVQRTHVPETFPQPPSHVLPEQTQLKRKQLPAVKVETEMFCPICESTVAGQHKPGCPEALPPTTTVPPTT